MIRYVISLITAGVAGYFVCKYKEQDRDAKDTEKKNKKTTKAQRTAFDAIMDDDKLSSMLDKFTKD